MPPAKKPAPGRYVVLRDFGGNAAGDVIEVDPATAADLIRDGIIRPENQE